MPQIASPFGGTIFSDTDIMTTFKSKKDIANIALAFFFTLTAGFCVADSAVAMVRPGATYAGGNLTLEAKNATVGELLETIARTAGIDIFVGPGFQAAGQKMSLKISDEPLEEAIRLILRGYNYAAIYEKEGNAFRVAALKIYPEGMATGAVVPLYSGGRTAVYEEKNKRGETVTVLVNAGGEMITHGGLEKRGALVPSQSVLNPAMDPAATLKTPWGALQLQLESEETAQFRDLMLLQKRLAAAQDPGLQKSLTLIFADETTKFYAAKRANINKIESLKRITQFKDMTGQ